MKHFLPDYFVCPSFLSPEESPSCTLYFLTVDQSSSHVPFRYFTFLLAVISLNAFKTRNKFFYNVKLKIKFILNKTCLICYCAQPFLSSFAHLPVMPRLWKRLTLKQPLLVSVCVWTCACAWTCSNDFSFSLYKQTIKSRWKCIW